MPLALLVDAITGIPVRSLMGNIPGSTVLFSPPLATALAQVKGDTFESPCQTSVHSVNCIVVQLPALLSLESLLSCSILVDDHCEKKAHS